MTNPFAPRRMALDERGGGQALPPFLQGRSRSPLGPFQSRPMITPKSTIRPGETKGLRPPLQRVQGARALATPTTPKITPAVTSTTSPAGQPAPAQTLYEFFKNDLERQRDAAIANAKTDASARGVYYGTPLTTSQGDIQTEFGRGLGQLQANILQNEQGNEFQRLQLATSLMGQNGQAPIGGISPEVFQQIGALFAPRLGPTAAPAITPATKPQPPLTKETLRR